MATDKRINILFIHANNYDIGGSDYCLLKLVLTLDRSRFKPIVLLGLKTEIADKYRKQGIPLMIVPMLRIKKIADHRYQLKFALLFLPTVLKIVSIIKKYRIDIVHSNDFLDIYGPFAARLARVKSVQHDRLIMRRPEWLRRLLVRFLLLFNHQIIAVSEAVAKEMFNVNGKVHSNVTILYDWLDMEIVGHTGEIGEFRQEVGVTESATLIGVVGRLEQWKGQHIFIKAAREVVKLYSECRFAVVGGEVLGRGRERYRGKLEALAKRLQVFDKMVFTGHRTDIMNIMDALDILVHCSIEPEPFGLVIMEAMSRGKPIIAPREGGVLDQVIDRATGLLYDPGDHRDMARAICKLIEYPEMARQMGMAGKERVYRLFNRKKLCKQFETLYEELVEHDY